MSNDVVDLRDFYAQRLGTVARRFISRAVRARWAIANLEVAVHQSAAPDRLEAGVFRAGRGAVAQFAQIGWNR